MDERKRDKNRASFSTHCNEKPSPKSDDFDMRHFARHCGIWRKLSEEALPKRMSQLRAQNRRNRIPDLRELASVPIAIASWRRKILWDAAASSKRVCWRIIV
jgi:hypothetical protein